jgi:ATP-dependent Clp protease ATP-binding subunit ClpA
MKQINTIDGLSAAGRLTQYLKKAIIKATELAKKRGGDFIELQDIFVAILEDRKNIGTRVLEKMGVDIDMTLDTLDRNYISNYGRETSPIPSEEFRQALSDAFLIASDLSHVYVGTEHILLAILQFEEEPFVIDLKKVGIDIESVKSTVLSFGTYQPGIFSQLSEDDDQEPEKRSSLGLFARDMNSLAKDGKFMKVWGREDENLGLERLQ